MKISKLFLALTTLSLTLTACGATDATPTRTKATFQIIRDNDNKQVSAETVKNELTQRLQAIGGNDTKITLEGDVLHVDTNLPELNRGTTLDLATAKKVTIQEQRTKFTPAEADQINKYNQYQKDLIAAAHANAIKNPENIDAIVHSTSDEIDLVDNGIHGPIDEVSLAEPKIWEALTKTPLNGITPVVELSYVIWFAKVTNITDDGGYKTYHYQQVSRALKENGPYLNYMPVVNLSEHITKTTVVKKNAEDQDSHDYTIHLTLDSEGQRLMSEMTKSQLNRPLRLFIDDLPYTHITFKEVWTGTDLVLDDRYNEINTKDVSDRLKQGSLSTPLTLTSLSQY